jgi:hypothetical protein
MARSAASGIPPVPAGRLVPEGAASAVAQLPASGAWPERHRVASGRSLFEPEPPPEPAAPPEEDGRPANVHELFDDYRAGMLQGHPAGRGRRAVRPPLGPSGDGPPAAS